MIDPLATTYCAKTVDSYEPSDVEWLQVLKRYGVASDWYNICVAIAIAMQL